MHTRMHVGTWAQGHKAEILTGILLLFDARDAGKHTHTSMHTHTYTHVRTNAHVHACVHARTHACTLRLFEGHVG